MFDTTEKTRILLARTADGLWIVLATDGRATNEDIRELGAWADDLGLDAIPVDDSARFVVFDGYRNWTGPLGSWSSDDEGTVSFDGSYQILDMAKDHEKIRELCEMRPTDPEADAEAEKVRIQKGANEDDEDENSPRYRRS